MKTRTTAWAIALVLLFRASGGQTAPVQLQQPTATFSQTAITVQVVADSIDGVIDSRGWAIYPEITNQTAVFETSTDIGFAAGTLLRFTLIQAFPHFDSLPGHTLGRFRLSVTTDARDTFADGLASGGDVTATWTVLNPYSVQSANGTLFTKLSDNSILASGDVPGPTDIYTITAVTSLMNITGIRVEALQDASLPQNGPGRYRNGNFVLSELQLDAGLAVTNTPPSFAMEPAVTLSEDLGSQTITNWATNISPSTPPGNANEALQTVQFIVSNDNPSLFSSQPAIAPDGTLTFTSAFNACGSANVTVVGKDNGGTDLGGSDTSVPQSFTITVTCDSGHTEPVQLQQAAATFSQTAISVQLVPYAIDGVIDDRGWAIYPEITNQTAVFETSTDIGFAAGTLLRFTLIQAYPHFDSLPGHTLGRFRLSVTTDARDTFADGLASGGDVTATWTVLNPYSLQSANGTLFTKLSDNSILAGGDLPGPTDTYTISATTTLTNITGIRLEALQDASLPQNGPGRYRNGNFVLSELQLEAGLAVVNCPTAVATVSPTASIECVGLSNVVIAANQTEGCVVLDGAASSDPDGAALTYSWTVDGLEPSAQGALATNCLPLGSHEICLTVGDGNCADTTCVTVEVISPCQAVGALIAQVESSGLPRSRQRPLLATLKTACSSFDAGRLTPGVIQLKAFQNKVAAQIAPTDAAPSQRLIDCAQAIIDASSGP